MKLTNNRYKLIIVIQAFLLVMDLNINTFSILVRKHNAIMLILFILQDVCIVLALAALLLTFFSTYVFQAGLVELLYDKFRFTIMVCVVYFVLTTSVYIWMLSVRWKEPLKHNWSVGLYIMYIIQRFVAPIYYYFYKRAMLRISDPRFLRIWNGIRATQPRTSMEWLNNTRGALNTVQHSHISPLENK